jgi:predicted dehydrogenase
MSAKTIKVALVGCGQIADNHLQEIRKLGWARCVGVCDRQRDLAEQAAARFEVPAAFDDLDQMLAATRPDVLHITTPPATHAPLALKALEAGVHLYVEKPFMLDLSETEKVLDAARAKKRLLCVGHDQLYDPIWEECRRLVGRGELGRIVHVDSVLSYDLKGPFGQSLTADPEHWVHRLPGGLFHNTMSHPLYRITDFLSDRRPRILASWFDGPRGPGFPTELRVLLLGAQTTGNLLFTSSVAPAQRVTRLYGTRQCIEVDLDARVLRRMRGATLPGPFGKLQVPFRHLREAAGNLAKNLRRFARSDLHYFTGMKRLFGLFYQAILDGGEPPIPYDEICRVTAIMDEIFLQCRDSRSPGDLSGCGRSARVNGAYATRLDRSL